jgi:2-amino-4-hydroxy-6-hydroxymethyldihydropteridine diphosphokinase
MTRVGLALGSNIGNRLDHLGAAVERLQAIRSGDHWLGSFIYETAPINCPPGAESFLNAVVEFDTTLDLLAFHDATLAIEAALGRPERRPRHAPRPIDLDILYFGDLHLESDQLTLPHPRIHEREFVLRPLADIRPDLVDLTQLAATVDPEHPLQRFRRTRLSP